jgi:large subunit ribosomal protein L24
MGKKMKIRKGDTVQIITGKDRGQTGKVIKTLPDSNRILVEGVNRVKRHTKAGQGGQAGGIVTQEAYIHISNVMVVGDDGKATRVGKRRETVDKNRPDGTTYAATRGVRVSTRTGKDIS